MGADPPGWAALTGEVYKADFRTPARRKMSRACRSPKASRQRTSGSSFFFQAAPFINGTGNRVLDLGHDADGLADPGHLVDPRRQAGAHGTEQQQPGFGHIGHHQAFLVVELPGARGHGDVVNRTVLHVLQKPVREDQGIGKKAPPGFIDPGPLQDHRRPQAAGGEDDLFGAHLEPSAGPLPADAHGPAALGDDPVPRGFAA